MEEKIEKTEKVEKINKYKKIVKVLSLLWNFLIIGVYASLSAISIIKDYGNLYTYILIGLVSLNIIISLLIAILKYKGKKKSAAFLKDSKSAIALFKKFLTLSNLLMGVVACISSFSIKDASSVLSLLMAIFSITLVVVQIIFSIVMFIVKKYFKRKARGVKEKFGELKSSINNYVSRAEDVKDRLIEKYTKKQEKEEKADNEE